MDSFADKLRALFERYPHLADGDHDKELIAKYLEVYHNFVIPVEVLNQIPSFETIRRTRQYYTAELEAAAATETDRDGQIQHEEAVNFLRFLIEERGYKIAPAHPMIQKLAGLEPTLFGTKDDVSLVGLVWALSDLVSDPAKVTKLLDLLLWVQQYPGMDRNPILVLTGGLTPEGSKVFETLKRYGWTVRFGS